jgi:hypothetical protein
MALTDEEEGKTRALLTAYDEAMSIGEMDLLENPDFEKLLLEVEHSEDGSVNKLFASALLGSGDFKATNISGWTGAFPISNGSDTIQLTEPLRTGVFYLIEFYRGPVVSAKQPLPLILFLTDTTPRYLGTHVFSTSSGNTDAWYSLRIRSDSELQFSDFNANFDILGIYKITPR